MEIPDDGPTYNEGETAVFSPPTTDLLTLEATKIDESLSSQLAIRITDAAGNITECDPVNTIVTRGESKPVSQTHTNIPEEWSMVNIVNGAPGVRNMDIVVNGQRFKVNGLADEAVINVDISSAMVAGDNNTITLVARGRPNASAMVTIHN